MATKKELEGLVDNYRLIKDAVHEILEMVERNDLKPAILSLRALSGTMYHAVRILEEKLREGEEA